jgi:hypothetical protein
MALKEDASFKGRKASEWLWTRDSEGKTVSRMIYEQALKLSNFMPEMKPGLGWCHCFGISSLETPPKGKGSPRVIQFNWYIER